MKFSLFAILPVVGFLTTAAANPVVVPDTAAVVEKRQADLSSVQSILQGLITNVQQHTAIINQTVAGGNSLTTDLGVATQFTAISALVNQATASVTQLAKRDGALIARQVDATTIVNLLGSLLSELVGTINNAVNSLGLGSLLSVLNPLGTALSNLLLALEQVVNNLLALVQQLLDGILTDLANALGGFNFGL